MYIRTKTFRRKMRIFMAIFFCCLFSLSFLAHLDAKEVLLSDKETRALSEFAKHRIGINPITKKYITGILYVGMPEEEFVKQFTWNESFDGTIKPYITKHVKNIYYIKVPFTKILNRTFGSVNRETERITFRDGKLIKYERQYRAQPPFMFLVYSDDTYLLSDEYKTTDIKSK